jgi:hypothetical protein
MRNVTIRRIGVVRAANVAALLLAVLALVLGLIFLVPFSLMILAVGRGPEVVGTLSPGSRVMGLLLMYGFGVAGYAVIGWVMTAIACVAYNVAAGRLGGIRVQIQEDAPYLGAPAYGAGPGIPPPPPGWR